MGIDLEFALNEDEFEVLPLGRNCEPAGLPWLLVVCSLLKPEDVGIELECLVLVAHDEGRMGQLLNHTISYVRIVI